MAKNCQKGPSLMATFKGDDFLEKIGKQTIRFNNPPTIVDCASIVGPKESERSFG